MATKISAQIQSQFLGILMQKKEANDEVINNKLRVEQLDQENRLSLYFELDVVCLFEARFLQVGPATSPHAYWDS
jgi:hypothetical protein